MYALLVCQFGVFCRYPTRKTYWTLKDLSSLEWVSAVLTQLFLCCDFNLFCFVGDGYANSFEKFVEAQLKLQEVENLFVICSMILCLSHKLC